MQKGIQKMVFNVNYFNAQSLLEDMEIAIPILEKWRSWFHKNEANKRSLDSTLTHEQFLKFATNFLKPQSYGAQIPNRFNRLREQKY